MLKKLCGLMSVLCALPNAVVAFDTFDQFEFPQVLSLQKFEVHRTDHFVSGRCGDCEVPMGYMVLLTPDKENLADLIRHGEITRDDLIEGSSACVGALECRSGEMILARPYAGYTQVTFQESLGFGKNTVLSDGAMAVTISASARTQEMAEALHDVLFREIAAEFGQGK